MHCIDYDNQLANCSFLQFEKLSMLDCNTIVYSQEHIFIVIAMVRGDLCICTHSLALARELVHFQFFPNVESCMQYLYIL